MEQLCGVRKVSIDIRRKGVVFEVEINRSREWLPMGGGWAEKVEMVIVVIILMADFTTWRFDDCFDRFMRVCLRLSGVGRWWRDVEMVIWRAKASFEIEQVSS